MAPSDLTKSPKHEARVDKLHVGGEKKEELTSNPHFGPSQYVAVEQLHAVIKLQGEQQSLCLQPAKRKHEIMHEGFLRPERDRRYLWKQDSCRSI